MKVTVSRRAHFNAAHRLFVRDWSDEKNMEVFGVCSNSNYHGHNYELIVDVTGDVNPITGMVIDLKDLKDKRIAMGFLGNRGRCCKQYRPTMRIITTHQAPSALATG